MKEVVRIRARKTTETTVKGLEGSGSLLEGLVSELECVEMCKCIDRKPRLCFERLEGSKAVAVLILGSTGIGTGY